MLIVLSQLKADGTSRQEKRYGDEDAETGADAPPAKQARVDEATDLGRW